MPKKPGCYLMKRANGQIIYVGKAKNLKARVASYFQKGAKSPKTEILVGHIREFEFIMTENETEALVLENNLIKKHVPKYNVMLKDDKSYPYVEVNQAEEFPRVQYIRRPKRGAKREVFGPFVWGSNISEVLRIVTKSFTLRDCTLREMKSRKEPCLLYQLHQCSAPCVAKISESDYREDLEKAVNFFTGKGQESIQILEDKMLTLAAEEKFERAAIIRDYIVILQEFLDYANQKNAELDGSDENIDIFAYHRGDIEIDISIYMVRNGILLGHKNFHFPTIDLEEEGELEDAILSYMYQYYSTTYDSFPDIIVSPFSKEMNGIFESGLRNYHQLKIVTPGKRYLSMMNLTKDHANENQRVRIKNEESVYVGLNKLKDLLSLPERPVLLECYDVAIFQGKSPTASQIVFRDGRAVKSAYRHYHLEERPEGNNDFEMMKEVLRRRIPHGDLPDVFIVDGGKGQVSMFRGVLEEFELAIPVVGIAKEKTKGSFRSDKIQKSDERLIIPGRSNPYILQKNKSLMKITVSMRDEAHRFSRVLHHKKEKQRTFNSWLDAVPGVGIKTKSIILKNLKLNQEELAELGVAQISQQLGISLKIAENILDHIRGHKKSPS